MKGSCQCGAVRYEVTGKVDHVSHCHCSMCRKLQGALFVSFGGVARDDLKVEGRESLREYRSSDAISRRFCATCGGHVFAEIPEDDDTVFLCLGSLDQGESPDHDPASERHIFWESRVRWHDPGDGAERVEGYGET